jgi:iron(II)-dependent oxidoreductase
MAVIEATASQLLEQLHQARAESDHLFRILRPEALYERPIAERHRVIFYLGHLDGFDSIRICRETLGLKSADPEFDALFQAGIDPDSGHLPTDTAADWPTLDRVQAYVRRCRAKVDDCLERVPEEVAWMALEHRLMHLETLAYMFHNFYYESKVHVAQQHIQRTPARKVQNHWCEIPAGEAVLGKPHDGTFGWDNEYDQLRVMVPAFRIQRHSITNGDYLQFVKDCASVPHFWIKRGNAIYYRGMFEEIPLPLDWPVYVTQQEAEAFVAWSGKTLPSEEQFHRAAYGTVTGENTPYPWGKAEPIPARGNFNFTSWNPQPVDATPEGDSAFGVSQLIGNGWEWTCTPFGPFPGFRPHDIYPGYSANFFDGDHFVLKGGSARTAARLLRPSFRNWFRRDYPYVYATFRCVEN